MNSPLRMVSYNVRYFGHALRGLASTARSKRGIAAGLASLNPLPDLICFQEVETKSIRSTIALKLEDPTRTQLESFMDTFAKVFAERKEEFPYEAFYFRAHAYRVGATSLYTTGLAVIVNMKTLRVQGHNVDSPHHITFHHVERFKDRKQSRICAHMKVSTLDGRPFHIFNTHLSLPTPFAKEFWSRNEKMGWGANQLHEARTLCDFVSRHAGTEPFIVCGDFNSPPCSPVYDFLVKEAKFDGAQTRCGLIDGTSATAYPTAGFMHMRMHLDHVFCGNGLEWLDMQETCKFGDPTSKFHGLSDHMPMIARFKLPA